MGCAYTSIQRNIPHVQKNSAELTQLNPCKSNPNKSEIGILSDQLAKDDENCREMFEKSAKTKKWKYMG